MQILIRREKKMEAEQSEREREITRRDRQIPGIILSCGGYPKISVPISSRTATIPMGCIFMITFDPELSRSQIYLREFDSRTRERRDGARATINSLRTGPCLEMCARELVCVGSSREGVKFNKSKPVRPFARYAGRAPVAVGLCGSLESRLALSLALYVRMKAPLLKEGILYSSRICVTGLTATCTRGGP